MSNEQQKNYEKKGFTFSDFEGILSKDFRFNKVNNKAYIINENGKKIDPKKTFGFIPYCLKPLKCKYRLDYSCHNFDQNICSKCIVKKLINFYESLEIPYYHIIRDDDDVPRAIKLFNKKYGKFEAVIAVSCPRAVLENKKYIAKYNVPVIFISLIGWNNCEIRKALQGKWWGKTSLNIKKMEEACKACLNSLLKN